MSSDPADTGQRETAFLTHVDITAWLMKLLGTDAALQTDASGGWVPPLSD